MNTYPTLPTEWYDDKVHFAIAIDEASNGQVRTRVQSDRRRREFPLKHPRLSAAEKDTLLAFFDANAHLPFFFTRTRAAAETYTCAFVSAPVDKYVKGGRYDVSVTLREL